MNDDTVARPVDGQVRRAGDSAGEEIPGYWFGEGQAPDFDRSVAKASEAVRAAEQALLDALRLGYPVGWLVEVVHSRGRFFGYVVGWDHRGTRVLVQNERTLKVSKWWAAHVQRSV